MDAWPWWWWLAALAAVALLIGLLARFAPGEQAAEPETGEMTPMTTTTDTPPARVTVTLDFEVGTLDQLGIGTLQMPWVDGTEGDGEFDLTVGAGLGNPVMQASYAEDGRRLYARADISGVARQIWTILRDQAAAPPAAHHEDA